MSFIEGFASTFVPGLRAMDERAFKEKQTALSMGWEDFTKSRDTAAAKNAENEKNLRKAKAYADQYGVPPGGLSQIYEWVSSGQDDKHIAGMLEGGSWEKRNTAAPTSKQLSGKEATDFLFTGVDPRQNVNEQTAQATGMQAPSAPAPEAPKKEVQPAKRANMFGGLLSSSSGKFNDQGQDKGQFEKIQSESRNQIGAALGKTPEQLQEITTVRPTQFTPEQSDMVFKRKPVDPSLDLDVNSKGKAIAAVQRTKMELENNPTPANKKAHDLASSTLAAWNENEYELENHKAVAANKYAPGGVKVAMFSGDGTYLGPKNLINLKDNGDGTATDPQTNQTVRIEPITEATQKQQQEITQRIAKEFRPVQVKQQNVTSLLKDYNDIQIILKDNPDALNAYTTGTAAGINTVLNELGAGINLIQLTTNDGKLIENIGPAEIENNIQAAQTAINSGRLDHIRQAAAAGALIEGKRALMTYRIGMAMGKEGRSLTNEDRNIFSDMILKGKNDGTLDRNFANIFFSIADNVDREGKAIINDDVELQEFQASNGFPAVSSVNPNFMDSLENSSDPVIRDTFNKLSRARAGVSGNDVAANARQNTINQPQEAPQGEPVRVQSPQEAMKLPSGTVFITPDGRRKVVP